MIQTGRIRKAAVFLLCGIFLIGYKPEKSIALDKVTNAVSNPNPNQTPAKASDSGPAALTTQLHNLRVGVHTDFTRIVFNSEGAHPIRIGPASPDGITIQYEQLVLLFDPKRLARTYRGTIAKISSQKENKAWKILVGFRQPDTRVKTFFLEADPPQKGAYRLVMDFYPPPSFGDREAVSSSPKVDLKKIPEGRTKISKQAPAAAPRPETKEPAQAAAQSREIVSPQIPSQPAELVAQLEKTGSNEAKSSEVSAPRQGIVPLEVPTRPRRAPERLGLTPRGYTSRYFHMARPRLGLGLSYEYEEEQRQDPGTDTTDTSHEFRERLEIETSGWAYHPALMKYTLAAAPEWAQTKQDRELGDSGTDKVFVPTYAVDAVFLEPKPYTLHGFANRREISLRSAFTEDSDTTIDTYGGDLRLKYYRSLPTLLQYTHTDTDQSGFFDSTGERDDFQLQSRHVTSKSTTTLTSLYSDDERKSSGDTARVKTFNGNLGNDWDIAGDQNKRLLSTLSYRWTEADSQENWDLLLSENLFWRHTPTLYTDYFAAYEKNESDDFDIESGTFRAKLQHLLYENLTTTATVGADLNDSTAGNENIYDGNLDLFYRRKIPWGALNIRTEFDLRYTDREGFDQDLIQVTDEPHVLTTGEVTLLDNENVDINSIAVTDITGTIPYIENVDYTIAEIDSFVQISRTTTGAIANGQTVLIDYRFRSDPDFDDTVFSQAYNIQLYLWNALMLGYGFRQANQNIISGPSPENRIDDTAHTAELRLDLGWTDTRLTFEDIDSNSGISTRSWRASETLEFRPVRRLLFDITGSFGQTEFKDLGDTQDQYGLSSRFIWVPTGWCRFIVEGFLNKLSETGTLEETLDANLIANLELSYRIWKGNISYLYDQSETGDSKRTRQGVRVEILRILW